MSPKENAQALIKKFFDYASRGIQDADFTAEENAKQCAIICVEQIIEAAKDFDKKLDDFEGVQMFPEIYWQEVLEHIKNS